MSRKDEPERPEPKAVLRLWLVLTAAFCLATFLFYESFWITLFQTDVRSFHLGRAVSGPVAFVASLVFGAGAGLLVALVTLHRGRWRQVFRLSRARIIGALALAALTPLAVYGGIPWILLPTLLFSAYPFLSGQASGSLALLVFAPATLAVAIMIAYPISCLLVAGLRRKLLRFAGFTLVWWSAYCLLLLLLGVRKFVL